MLDLANKEVKEMGTDEIIVLAVVAIFMAASFILIHMTSSKNSKDESHDNDNNKDIRK